jgi:hypothetical protein
MLIAALFISVFLYLLFLYLVKKSPKRKQKFVDMLDNFENPFLFYISTFCILFGLTLLLLCIPLVMIPLYILVIVGIKLVSKIHSK